MTIHVTPEISQLRDAEITMLTLEKSSYAQKLDDAKHDIARLNAVIRAMATWCGNLSCPPNAVGPDSRCKSHKTCADCFIDHFTEQPELKKGWWYRHENSGNLVTIPDPHVGYNPKNYRPATLDDLAHTVKGTDVNVWMVDHGGNIVFYPYITILRDIMTFFAREIAEALHIPIICEEQAKELGLVK